MPEDLAAPETLTAPEKLATEKKTRKPRESKPKVAPRRRFRAKVVPIYHPYQKVQVPVAGDVPLDVDNWVVVQVSANVLIDMGPVR